MEKQKGIIRKFPALDSIIFCLVVSNVFYVHPYLGESSNLTNIFEMDWNHQLVFKGSMWNLE